MKIPESVIEDISSRLSIVEVVGDYVSLKRKGGRFWGCCPFHNEKTPSFSVNQERNMYYCFGCHKGGSIFNFIMEVENMPFVDAVQFLGKKAGVPVVLRQENPDMRMRREALLELYKRVGGSFNYILNNSDSASSARDYIKSRGFSDKTIEDFNLGYAPDSKKWLYDFLKSKNYSDKFLDESGLFSKNYRGITIFSNRLMFPVFNVHGELVAFSGRGLSENGPKYINSPETSIYHKGSTLFGINLAAKSIRKEKHFILCEGNADVMALHQAGFTNAVAPLGTAFTLPQAKLLKRYADEGILLFDGDSAGVKATEKAAVILEGIDVKVKIAVLEKGEDPADILQKSGEDGLKNKLKYTINSFDYLLKAKVEDFDITTPEGKEGIARGIIPYIQSINSDVRKEACINRLAEELRVSPQTIFNELLNNNKPAREIAPKTQQTQVLTLKNDMELYLMFVLAVNLDYFSSVTEFISQYKLKSVAALTVYNAIKQAVEEGGNTLDSIVRRIADDSLRSLTISKCSSEEYTSNPEKLIEDSVLYLKKQKLLERSAELEKQIIECTGMNDMEKIGVLLKQKLDLDEKLRVIEGK